VLIIVYWKLLKSIYQFARHHTHHEINNISCSSHLDYLFTSTYCICTFVFSAFSNDVVCHFNLIFRWWHHQYSFAFFDNSVIKLKFLSFVLMVTNFVFMYNNKIYSSRWSDFHFVKFFNVYLKYSYHLKKTRVLETFKLSIFFIWNIKSKYLIVAYLMRIFFGASSLKHQNCNLCHCMY